MDATTAIDNGSTPANPLTDGSEIERGCWALGHHNGFNDLETASDDAVSAVAHVCLQSSIRGAIETLSALNGQLRVAEEAVSRSGLAVAAASRHLLEHFGRHSVGLLPWLVVGGYHLLAVIAVAAEFPVSMLTIGESPLGNLNAAQMGSVRIISVWALGGMMCLLGLSLKLLNDALDRLSWRRWLEPLIVLSAVALSAVSLAGIAHLRHAIGRQASTVLENAPIDVQLAAARAVADWSDFTFMWVTLTLPCFSAACVVVALHQSRDYRLHNRALKNLLAAEQANSKAVGEIAAMTSRIEAGERAVGELRALDVSDPRVHGRYRASYQQGFATGRRKRELELGGRGVYEKLKHLVAVSA